MNPRIATRSHRTLLVRSVIAVTLATLTLSACNDHQKNTAGTATGATAAATTEAASATPNPTTSVDATKLIGRMTVTEDQLALCGLDDTVADGSPAETTGSFVNETYTDDPSGLATTEAPVGESPVGSWLMPGGMFIERCGDGELIGVNALSGEKAWTFQTQLNPSSSDNSSDSVNDSIEVGTRHVFIVRTTQQAATGLDDTAYAREVIALSARTGTQVWTKRIETSLDAAEISTDVAPEFEVVESGGGTTGLTPTVALKVSEWSAFNADTGEALWENADGFLKIGTAEEGFGQPTYVGDSLVLTEGYDTNVLIHALDPREPTKVQWKAELPTNVSSDWVLNGTTLRQISEDGVNTIDIATGKTGTAYRFPSEWLSTITDGTYALALSGDNLVMTTVDKVRAPIWSQPSGTQVTPLAVSADTVIVRAESGIQVLDGRTGEIRTDVPTLEDFTYNTTAVDGLVELSGGIFELSPPKELLP